MRKEGKIIIVSLIASLLAVITYILIQLAKISKAPFKYAGVKINKVSFQRIEITVFLKLVNEGSLSVTVSDQEYDVFLNDKFISHLKNSVPYKIKPGTNIMPLDVFINTTDVLKAGWSNLSQLLLDKSKVNISLKGGYDLKIGFIRIGKQVMQQTFNLGQSQQSQPETTQTT